MPRILVVEDDADLRILLSLRLSRKCYDVVTAGDVREACELMFESSHNVDVVICDIGLPDEDGYRLLERLRGWSEAPKVIMMSGYTADIHRPKSLAAGAIAFFQKPIDFRGLVDAIEIALHPESAARPSAAQRPMHGAKR